MSVTINGRLVCKRTKATEKRHQIPYVKACLTNDTLSKISASKLVFHLVTRATS